MMKKLFLLAISLLVSVAMLLTACKKDDPKPDNGNNNNNQETPGGGGEGGEGGGGEVTPNQEYPETAVVLPQAVTDIDGNTYDAVQIGDQVWMAENLRTTRYADGTTIFLGTSTSSTIAYRYAPGSNQSNGGNMGNVDHYGYLYNWRATMHGASSSAANPSGVQGVCPDGWHVPSDAEWKELTNYMKTQSVYTAGGNSEYIAKALSATWGWQFSSEPQAPGHNPSTNNASGFSALPAGYYGYDHYDQFGTAANFWSTTMGDNGNSVYIRFIGHNISNALRSPFDKENACSVRCVRD